MDRVTPVAKAKSDSMRDPGTSVRTAGRLAWSLFAACAVLIAFALSLDFLTDPVPLLPEERLDPGLAVLAGVLSLVYPTVGALVASRFPSNPIGWIFCGVGLLYAVRRFCTAYADYALLENITLPAGEYVAWFATWVGDTGLILAGLFLMLLFPEGRLPSRRWRMVAWAAVLGAALLVLGNAFMPGQLPWHNYVQNPFGVVGVLGSGFTTYDLFAVSRLLGLTLLLTSTLAALFSLFLRLRRARGDQRQQQRWFVYAAVPTAVCLSPVLLQFMVYTIATDFLLDSVWIVPWRVYNAVLYAAWVALLVLPVFTYIAILKYRLYDIDVVINRTLVYGALTVMLATVYFGGVTATQAMFRTLTGQEKQSQLAVVISTLVIAALFNPLRRRIQAFIDRRFYRRKYDAGKTLEAFTAKLRDETDLNALSDDLVGVVRETMQPAHVSLWLRPDPPPRGRRA
jgi:MFS family permease